MNADPRYFRYPAGLLQSRLPGKSPLTCGVDPDVPLFLRVPLPGPFTYSKRIGGKRRRQPSEPDPVAGAIGLVAGLLFLAFIGFGAWAIPICIFVVGMGILGWIGRRKDKSP